MKRILIRKAALESILGISRSRYPNESVGLLRGNEKLIEEFIIAPGSVQGDSFASISPHMLPIDKSIIGSFHSHPGNSFKPSRADLKFFGKSGVVHLILKRPYAGINDVAAYDKHGNGIELALEE